MELTMFIESDLKVHISAEDWVTFPLSTVHEISQFVARRRKGEV
jgi:acyl carrier protein